MREALIILAAVVAYFAAAIPFAFIVGKSIKQDFNDMEWPRDLDGPE